MRSSLFIAVLINFFALIQAAEMNLEGVNLDVLKKVYPEATKKAILKQNFWNLSTELVPGKTTSLDTLKSINSMAMEAAKSYPDIRKDDLWRKCFVNSLFMIFMNEKQDFSDSLELYTSWMDCLRAPSPDGWTHSQESMALVQLGAWLLSQVPSEQDETAWKIISLTDTRSGDFPRNELIISWAFAKRKFLSSQYRLLIRGKFHQPDDEIAAQKLTEQMDSILTDERLPLDFRANTLDEFARMFYSCADFGMATRLIEKYPSLNGLPVIMNLLFCIRLYGHGDMEGARKIFSEWETKVNKGELAKDDNWYRITSRAYLDNLGKSEFEIKQQSRRFIESARKNTLIH